MLDQIKCLPQSASEILGDLTAFAEQLGSGVELGPLPVAAASLELSPINTPAGLQSFLTSYASAVLAPHELPAVIRAYEHAARGQHRELVGLDKEISALPVLQSFAKASSTVGQAQLRRLRPLRGERVVHRYLQAVEQGAAGGWHTVVYGLILAVYSIPLRQGVAHFSQRTLEGFVQAASNRFTLPEEEQATILAGPSAVAAAALESVIARHAAAPILVS